MPGEITTCEQRCLGSLQIARCNHKGWSCELFMGGKKIRCSPAINKPFAATHEWHGIYDRACSHTRDGRRSFCQFLLQRKHFCIPVSRCAQVGPGKGDTFRLKCQWLM